ncbi:MAG: hypothetical protein Q9M41_12265 [Paracoccaceae bacterium]|nr:hypothetical protein [Paracoccaceae bacterium]
MKTRNAIAGAAMLGAAFMASPTLASSYVIVMGFGGNSCGEVIKLVENGNKNATGQIAGWILGYWSAATAFVNDQSFTDKVKAAGARKIFSLTLEQCRKADPATPLMVVTHQAIQAAR